MNLGIFKPKKKKEGFIIDISNELINVELIVRNIESSHANLNIEEEKQVLENLKQEIDANAFNGEKIDTALIKVYQSLTERLMSIKSSLERYENLMILMNKSSQLESAIKSNEVSSNLPLYIDLALELLEDLSKTKISILSQNGFIYEKIYRVIYEIIKIEIMYTLESKVLEKLKTDTTGTYYIDSIIRKEIEEIHKSSYIDNLKLVDRLDMFTSRSASASLSSNLVDKDIILTIVLISKRDEVSKTLYAKTDEIALNYTQNLNAIETYLSSPQGTIAKTQIDLEEHKEKLREINKDMKKKLISLLISTTIFTVVGLNIPSIGISVNNQYVTTTEIYETGKEPIILTSYKSRSSALNRKLKIYEETKKSLSSYTRSYKIYDVTNVILDGSNQDYLDIDVESFNIKGSHSYTENVDSIEKEGRQLTVTTQDHDNPILNEGKYRTFLVIAYISLLAFQINKKISPIRNLIDLIMLANKHDDEISLIDLYNSELKELIDECSAYISSNQELERIYYNIYIHELQYLTTEEIQDKLTSLIEQNKEHKKTLEKFEV